jgi:hypothetical protein
MVEVMSTIDCARTAFELEYAQLLIRAKAACRAVPRANKQDKIQSWLLRFWESFLEFCKQEQIDDPEIAIACLSLVRIKRNPAKQAEDNLESLQIPDCLGFVDGILLTGFVQGDSDAELSALTDIPRRLLPSVILDSLERAEPILTVRACCARLARLDSGAPNEVGDIADLIDYVFTRVSLITSEN